MSSRYNVIGLMSGTSLDGLDMINCEFTLLNGKWKYEIHHSQTIPYPSDLERLLSNCTTLSGLELTQLDHKLGQFYGEKILEFTSDQKIKTDFIASHGHTVFHQPEKGFTLQIGNLHQIHSKTKIPVIGDFRTTDVALGGQGAPLVPVGDKLLFGAYDYCLNLGGIGNISCDKGQERIAYDICPVNMVLNTLSGKIGLKYDEGGRTAEIGQLDKGLLDKLNNLDYYHQPAPKSLGIEWVKEFVFPILNLSKRNIPDLLHSFCHHIAYQVKNNIDTDQNKKLLITGGGAFNSFLVKLIEKYCGGNTQVLLPDQKIIEYKEALIFAFLGVLKYRNEINILKSVTGALKDSSSGVIITSEPK